MRKMKSKRRNHRSRRIAEEEEDKDTEKEV